MSSQNQSKLEKLNMSTCRFTSLSASRSSLTTNVHLEELNISENALCDYGIQHLVHALRVNQGLKRLSLVNCFITDNGLQYLAEAIQDNHSLSTLFVHNCLFSNLISETIIPVLVECTITP